MSTRIEQELAASNRLAKAKERENLELRRALMNICKHQLNKKTSTGQLAKTYWKKYGLDVLHKAEEMK